MSFNDFHAAFKEITVCWVGKYDRVKYFKGTSANGYTLTTNKPTEKEDVVVSGFQSSDRSVKGNPRMEFDFRLQSSRQKIHSWNGQSSVVSSIHEGAFVMQPNTAYSLDLRGEVAGTTFHVRKGSKITLTVKESSAQS